MRKTPYRIRDFQRVSGLYAFWSYDKFPYVLGGVVMAMADDGRIQAESYGGVFMPIKIVPRKRGEKLIVEIRKLQAERNRAREIFDKEWLAKLAEIFPEAAR